MTYTSPHHRHSFIDPKPAYRQLSDLMNSTSIPSSEDLADMEKFERIKALKLKNMASLQANNCKASEEDMLETHKTPEDLPPPSAERMAEIDRNFKRALRRMIRNASAQNNASAQTNDEDKA